MWRDLLHNLPTLKVIFALADVWKVLNLHGLLGHNVYIGSWIHGIRSNFDELDCRGPSSTFRIKPMTFEYHRFKMWGAIK
jgi:hypothetical protein